MEFFTFLLRDFSTKLAIPQACIEYFIKENSTYCQIRSPLGQSFHVQIHGDSNSLYLVDGWEKFAAAHKLSAGYLLKFKCKGGFVFNVNIFDLSTCEIDYNAINGQEGSNKPAVPSCSKTTAAVMEISKREFECSRKQTAPSCGQKGMQDMQDRKEKKATSCCKGGHCFKVAIKTYHKYNLEISLGIIESNDLSKIVQLLLKDPKGHLYLVELVHRKYQKRSFIVAGWRDFCDSNNLEVGDVCIFTFKSGTQKATFQVEVMKSKANGH